MDKPINCLRDTSEVMVQYSSDVIYMMDTVFQKQRILGSVCRAISESDLPVLRRMTAGSLALGMVTLMGATLGLINKFLSGIWAHVFLPDVLYSVLILTIALLMSGWSAYLVRKYGYTFFPVTAIGVCTAGLTVYHGNFSFGLNKHFPWRTIADIRIVQNAPTKHSVKLEAHLQITDLTGKLAKLQLNAIRSIEERKLLLESFKIFARKAIDPEGIARMVRVSDVQDIPFTQLWSEALLSSIPRSSSALLEPATVLQDGHFFIKRQIGGGGQGTIYLAEMLNSVDQKADVALKEYVLPDQEHLFDRKRAIEQFEREVHLLARLKHQNLANLIDAFIEDHRAYLVLEYLNGSNLKDLVKSSGKLSSQQCCQIALQICDVLGYLHSLIPPVVHLDVSPENIIIMPDGLIKLVDFNTSSDGSGLRTKLIIGKQRYMPPEQYRNEISPQCDIYGLGCTIFFMLTGIEPEPLTVLHPIEEVASLNPIFDQLVSEATSLNQETRTKTVSLIKDKLLLLSQSPLHLIHG